MIDDDESDGGCPWTSVSPGSISSGSNYDPNSASTSRLYSYDSLSFYDRVANSLEASISASAAPASSAVAGSLTDYVGIFGSVDTPVGGGEIDLGFYSNSYGSVGAYFGLGHAFGTRGASLGVVSGHTQSLAGDSLNVSGGFGYGLVGFSKGYSSDRSTGAMIGEQWSAYLAFGSQVAGPVSLAGSISFMSTTSTEFTSLYLAYIQFLNWVGYPGNSSMGYPGY